MNIRSVFSVALLTVMANFSFSQDKPLPTGEQGEKADQLAQKVLSAINYEAWKSTRFVQWTFVEKRNFVWDKFEQTVCVTWDENKVIYSTDTEKGIAFVSGKSVTEPGKLEKLIKNAVDAFNNDSFWLNAPSKVFSPGTERRLVSSENGDQLLITYTSGGSTPGDSYLWTLDENGRPTKWEMWVEIIPQGGVPTTWENWTETKTGAMISMKHLSGDREIPVTNVKTSQSVSDMDLIANPFEGYKK